LLVVLRAGYAKLFEECARTPPSLDLISMMVHRDAIRTQPQHKFIGNLALLIVRGNATTCNTVTGGLLALNENPDEWAKLCSNRDLVPSLCTRPSAIAFRHRPPLLAG